MASAKFLYIICLQIDRQIETLLKCQKPSSQGTNPLLIWGHQLGENIQIKKNKKNKKTKKKTKKQKKKQKTKKKQKKNKKKTKKNYIQQQVKYLQLTH